jgi:hypothetical protein
MAAACICEERGEGRVDSGERREERGERLVSSLTWDFNFLYYE